MLHLRFNFNLGKGNTMNKILVALGFTLLATSAQAAIFSTITAGSTSLQSGATTINFESNPADVAGVTSIIGGAIYSPPTQPGFSAIPAGSTGNFYSVGISNAVGQAPQNGPGVITLDNLASYYGFLWGSVDTFNTVQFLNGTNVVGTFSGSTFPPSTGNQAASIYVNFFAANSSDYFNKIVFTSTSNAFETDNHAFVSSVPVPAALPLMATAFGAFGIARRRNKAKAA